MKYLRDNGYVAAVVEKWNSFSRTRQDLFGFADIIAFNDDEVLLVQTTSSSNVAARRTKIYENELSRKWRKRSKTMFGPRRVEVHGWKKVKGRWKLTVHNIE